MYTMILIVTAWTSSASTASTVQSVATTSFPVKDEATCKEWREKLENESTRRIKVEAHCVPGVGK